jgi:hypothetical protein
VNGSFEGARFRFALDTEWLRRRYEDFDPAWKLNAVGLSERLSAESHWFTELDADKHASWLVARLFHRLSGGEERIVTTIEDVESHQAKFRPGYELRLVVHERDALVARTTIKGNRRSPGPGLDLDVWFGPGVEPGPIVDELVALLARKPDVLTICRYEVRNINTPSRKPHAFGWDGKRLL